MRSAWTLALLVASAALAGCTVPEDSSQAPIQPPSPSNEPEPAQPTGILHVGLAIEPASYVAPTDVDITLAIQSTNGIGQPLPADINWTLEVSDHPMSKRSGHGTGLHDTWHFGQRGEHTVKATATAEGFRPGGATATFRIEPRPIAADLEGPTNATKGQWFALNGTASNGYADLGTTCSWNANSTDALQVQDPAGCSTLARWLVAGNHTVIFTADDGVGNASASLRMEAMPIEPMPAPGKAVASPHIEDDSADPADAAPVARTNITSAWFQSDLDHLYVGMAIQDIPEDPGTSGSLYRLSFSHDWNTSTGGSFRVVAAHEPIEDGAPGEMSFFLEAGSADGWETAGALPGSSMDPGTDILWWVVPRALLEAPLEGGTIGDFAAQAGPTVGPAEIHDRATGEGTYVLD